MDGDKPGEVEVSTRREIAVLVELHPAAERLSLAATAVMLARRVDNPRTSATAMSNAARELRESMRELRALLPEALRDSWLDRLRASLDDDPGRTGDPAGQSAAEPVVAAGGGS